MQRQYKPISDFQGRYVRNMHNSPTEQSDSEYCLDAAIKNISLNVPPTLMPSPTYGANRNFSRDFSETRDNSPRGSIGRGLSYTRVTYERRPALLSHSRTLKLFTYRMADHGLHYSARAVLEPPHSIFIPRRYILWVLTRGIDRVGVTCRSTCTVRTER